MNIQPTRLSPEPDESLQYSVCTLVTRPAQYQEMLDSFLQAGFDGDTTEYLYLDNSGGNVVDAFAACRRFLTEASKPYVILCHQDILLIDGRARLDEVITDLEVRDPTWALIGNAGATVDGKLALRISDPHGENRMLGSPLPRRVMSLDENLIVVRRKANLSTSLDLQGFHLTGSDLCVLADVLGWNAYSVDFHVRHLSGGDKNESFYALKAAFERKYARAFRSRWLPLPTLSPLFLSGSPVARFLRKIRGAGRFNKAP